MTASFWRTNGNPQLDSCFTAHELQNTKTGERSLYYFNMRFPWITTNIPALPLTKIQSREWLTYLSGVIVVRLGIKTDNWGQLENLTQGERATWIHLKQFAWNSENAVAQSVLHHAQVHGF